MNHTFFTVVRWELRALAREPSCWIACLLAIAALAFALHNGLAWRGRLEALGVSAQRVKTEQAAHARTQAAELDRAPNPLITPTRDPRNPYGFAHFQMQHTIALPPTPLAALTTGQSDLLPQTLTLTPGTPPALLGSGEPENPHRLLIGSFDAAFVLVALAPLLVIALTHGLVAGERERGTLPLLLAQPVALRTIILGRLAPRMAIALALLALLAVAFLVFAGDAGASGHGGLRIAWWTAVGVAYGGFWFALSLFVITRAGHSATHALALAALWLALVMLVPAGINLAVKTLHPVPSRVDLILALRSATDDISSRTSRLLADYYEDHPEFAPKAGAATEYSEIRFITNEAIDRALAPVLARYEAQLARQQALVEQLQFLSPTLLAQGALADAAGTGIARQREFLRQAAQHHRELRAFFNPRILRKETFAAWDDVPSFRFVEEPGASVARRALPALVALVALSAAFGLGALRSLRRNPA